MIVIFFGQKMMGVKGKIGRCTLKEGEYRNGLTLLNVLYAAS